MNGFVRPPLPHMPVVQVGHRAGAGPGPPVLYTHPTASAPSRPFIHKPRGGSSTMVPSKNPVGRRGRAVAGGEERELAGLYLRRARAELDELASAGFMLAGNGFPQVLMLKGGGAIGGRPARGPRWHGVAGGPRPSRLCRRRLGRVLRIPGALVGEPVRPPAFSRRPRLGCRGLRPRACPCP